MRSMSLLSYVSALALILACALVFDANCMVNHRQPPHHRHKSSEPIPLADEAPEPMGVSSRQANAGNDDPCTLPKILCCDRRVAQRRAETNVWKRELLADVCSPEIKQECCNHRGATKSLGRAASHQTARFLMDKNAFVEWMACLASVLTFDWELKRKHCCKLRIFAKFRGCKPRHPHTTQSPHPTRPITTLAPPDPSTSPTPPPPESTSPRPTTSKPELTSSLKPRTSARPSTSVKPRTSGKPTSRKPDTPRPRPSSSRRPGPTTSAKPGSTTSSKPGPSTSLRPGPSIPPRPTMTTTTKKAKSTTTTRASKSTTTTTRKGGNGSTTTTRAGQTTNKSGTRSGRLKGGSMRKVDAAFNEDKEEEEDEDDNSEDDD